MANRIDDLEIDEISLVDRPANESARVVLMKRDDAPGETFEHVVAAIQKRDGCGQVAAMEAARRERPDLVRAGPAYRPGGDAGMRAPSADEIAFEEAVRQIMAADDVDRVAAMRRARERRPDLFARAYGSGAGR